VLSAAMVAAVVAFCPRSHRETFKHKLHADKWQEQDDSDKSRARISVGFSPPPEARALEWASVAE